MQSETERCSQRYMQYVDQYAQNDSIDWTIILDAIQGTVSSYNRLLSLVLIAAIFSAAIFWINRHLGKSHFIMKRQNINSDKLLHRSVLSCTYVSYFKKHDHFISWKCFVKTPAKKLEN